MNAMAGARAGLLVETAGAHGAVRLLELATGRALGTFRARSPDIHVRVLFTSGGPRFRSLAPRRTLVACSKAYAIPMTAPSGAPSPFPFSVSLIPTTLQDQGVYTLSIRVEAADGTLLYINDTVTPAIDSNGPTTDVVAKLIAVAAPACTPRPLRSWRWRGPRCAPRGYGLAISTVLSSAGSPLARQLARPLRSTLRVVTR